MIKNIIYVVILAVVLTVSWQIGSLAIEKKDISVMLEKSANSIKKFRNTTEAVKNNLENQLNQKGYPATFTIETLEEGKKIKIIYNFDRAASVFGFSYYETSDVITIETVE